MRRPSTGDCNEGLHYCMNKKIRRLRDYAQHDKITFRNHAW